MGNTLLRDADVCGMAHGLEIRVPLLDRVLVDYVYSLPGKWRVKHKGVNKPLLVEALGDEFRPELLTLGKRGFSLPIDHWMTGHLRQYCEHLLQRICEWGEIEPSAVKRVWSDFLSEPDGPAWSRAWLLIVLGAWYDKWDSTGR
jgi:asparagine synthase (glutamine-hydrolysing)